MASEELSSILKNCTTTLFNCSETILKHMEGDKKKQELEDLENCVQEYIKLDCLIAAHDQAFETYERELEVLKDKSAELDLDSGMKKLDTIFDRYMKHDPKKHPLMDEFEKKIKSIHSNNSDLNDSQMIISQTQSLIDPITKKRLKEPVKNNICGHIYEKSSIAYLMSNNRKTKCPLAGCGNSKCITMNDLIVDKHIEQLIAHLSQEAEDSS